MRNVFKIQLFYFILFMTMTASGQEDLYQDKREAMVKQQIQARGIKDKRVLEAMRQIPRHLFVAEESRSIVYGDYPVPIGFDQTISQPYIVAYMTEALQLNPQDKVLEIGTGCGYQTAVLARLVHKVFTVETIKELFQRAQETLSKLEYKNISYKMGDGYEGWKEESPFDAIMVTAAAPEIPKILIDQLKPGGRLVIPVGGAHQELFLITKTDKGIEKKSLGGVRFVPLIKSKD